MKKINVSYCRYWQWRKILLMMKLVWIFILAGIFSANAIESFSQSKRFDLKMKNASLKSILSEIEEKSDFNFFYKSEDIEGLTNLSINMSQATISDVLADLLKNKGFDFEIHDRYILIKKSEAETTFSGFVQQVKSVSGKVTDSSGQPLPGVSVVVKGTTTGTITDFDGKYTLSNVPGDATLVFSFVGMKSQEILIVGKTNINIAMEEKTVGIEEVVAIGYGTVKKSDLTGAVGSVSGSLVADRQVTQLSQALQGAMSGVMVTRNGNSPGTPATIRIRGITTIGTSAPLVIVDGVPVDNINSVNSNDVESISVLKDAASASIYGSRAAAGVILITTKRAKPEELGLEYNFEFGMEKPTTLADHVDAVRYMQIANESGWNDVGNNANEYPVYSKDLIENYYSLNKENPDLYPNTDWSELILKNNAPRQSHSVNVVAGTKVIRSKASFNYDKTGGLYNGLSLEQYSIRFSNDIKINKFIDCSLDMHYLYGLSEAPDVPESDIMFYSRISAPIYAAKWSDGRVAGGKNGDNIYAYLNYGGYNKSRSNSFTGKAQVDIRPFEGLKLSAVFSPQVYNSKAKNFITQIPYYSAEDPTIFKGYISRYNATSLKETRNDNYRVTTQFLANYIKTFGSHNINFLGGYEDFYAFNEGLNASRDQYTLTSFPYLNLGPLEYRDNAGSAYENAYRSVFGRLMYNYQNKYFLQGNVRYDGSSRFHSDYRWGVFPSFSAGWMISEENFMKGFDKLSSLKLRASWGTLGNERIGNYPYQSTIEFGNALFAGGSGVVSAQTAAQRQYVIENISWETTESYNIGFDASFFGSKLRLNGDYYKKTTKDMLLALEIPDYIGFDNPDQNTGKMFTNGWEVEAGWNDRVGEIGYSVSFNISDFKSVMGNLGGTEFLGNQIKKEGSEFNEWYGYKSAGLFQTKDDVTASALLKPATSPGDIKYVDISGPNGVPDGIISPDYDRALLGGSLPRYMFGSNFRINYKNFDFSMVIQGIGKQNAVKSSYMVQPLMELWGNIPSIIDNNYWSMYNTYDQNLKAKYPRIANSSNAINYVMSDYWMFNGGYLRVKNITLGYNIPSALLNKWSLKDLRIYSSFSDLFTFSKYPKGWDPEVSSTGYPITTSIIFGISVKF